MAVALGVREALVLEQNSVLVANCKSIVLHYAGWALPEQKDCLHGSSFDHLFTLTMEAASRCALR